MGRKTKTVMIEAEGRDKGKTFVLKEMSSDEGEHWALRVILAYLAAGGVLPDGVTKESGMAGVAEIGLAKLLGNIPEERVFSILAEMWPCVKYQHKPNQPLQEIVTGDNCQIEEIATRLLLRMEVFNLHTGFSPAAATQTTESQPLRAVASA